jgi:hypothetical protein
MAGGINGWLEASPSSVSSAQQLSATKNKHLNKRMHALIAPCTIYIIVNIGHPNSILTEITIPYAAFLFKKNIKMLK